MTIFSIDKSDWLSIERCQSDPYVEFDISVSFAGQTLTAYALGLGARHQFLAAAAEFERTRTGAIEISGDDSSFLKIETRDLSGHAWLLFSITRRLFVGGSLPGGPREGSVCLAGEFPLDSEFIGQMVQDFKHILRDDYTTVA